MTLEGHQDANVDSRFVNLMVPGTPKLSGHTSLLFKLDIRLVLVSAILVPSIVFDLSCSSFESTYCHLPLRGMLFQVTSAPVLIKLRTVMGHLLFSPR